MLNALHHLLPSAPRIMPSQFYVTADSVLQTLEEDGVPFEFHRLGEVDWELENAGLEDDDILKLLSMSEAGHRGTLLIETAGCAMVGLPCLACPVDELASFVHAYPSNLGSQAPTIGMFFDGDVIMVCEESRTITVYHHGGGYAHAYVPERESGRA
ncbi:hypothetical protein [Blastopirellula marina]|nr:hypothetical protein [Blastopirellula marina]